MSKSILAKKALIDNPSPRIPVCLCLDASASMERVIGGNYHETGQTTIMDGQEWTLVTGETITCKDNLLKALASFYKTVREDEVACNAAEISIITFSDTAQLIRDFNTVTYQDAPKDITTGDMTNMGDALEMALKELEERKKEYRSTGVDYYQPWLVVMTDGQANGDQAVLEQAVQKINDMVNRNKLTVFPVGIDDAADMETLEKLSPKLKPLKMNSLDFGKFFTWLSQSISATSNSMPGEDIKFDRDFDDIFS